MAVILDEQVLNIWRLMDNDEWVFKTVGLQLSIEQTKKYCLEKDIKAIKIIYLDGSKKALEF